MNCLQCEKTMSISVAPIYHYKESGLTNVYLKDSATVYRCGCGNQFIEIPTIERLNDAIAYAILTKRSLVVPAEFRFLRKWIGLTAEKLATSLGVKSRHSISYWENGKRSITATIDHAMRLLVLRLKEQKIKRRMNIEIEDYLRQTAKKPSKSERITIDSGTIRNLPFPPSSAAHRAEVTR